mgnify:CR=1 FL=1
MTFQISATARTTLCLTVLACCAAPGLAQDWPQWGRTAYRNMVCPDAGNLPTSFDVGRMIPDTEEVDLSTTRNVRFAVKLGSQTYGNPTIANGRVLVGTNNESARNPKYAGQDRSPVYCFDEKTGAFLWEFNAPKLDAGKVSDWEFIGICSSPTIIGDRIYVVSNRAEVICLDLHGLANGNDGPFKDEALYYGAGKPIKICPTDADILWRFDMRDELGVFPHNIASNSVLYYEGVLYLSTSNGVDWTHTNIPNPRAPAFIALDAKTGELLGEETSGVSRRMLHCNWSSPTIARIGKQRQMVVGGGDGWVYAYAPRPVKDEEGIGILQELWRFDANPPHYRVDNDGNPIRYATTRGPSEIISTPVEVDGLIYVTIGQDPEHGEGIGALSCIDPGDLTGDISQSGLKWRYERIGRSISTPAVYDGLVYAVDYNGVVHCVDAKSGEPQWTFDTGSHLWASPLVADGKLYIGNEDGDLVILAAGRERKLLGRINMGASIYSSPVVANNTLFIATQTHLWAIAEGAEPAAPATQPAAPAKEAPKAGPKAE